MTIPLRVRFALLAAALVFVVSSLVGVVGYLTLRHSLLNRESGAARVEATRLAGLVAPIGGGGGQAVDITDLSLTRQLSTPGLAVEIDRPNGTIVQATGARSHARVIPLPKQVRERCLAVGSAATRLIAPAEQLACSRVGPADRPLGTITVAASLRDALDSLDTLRRSLIAGVLGGSVLAALLSLWVGRQTLLPLKRMAAAAETIRSGDLGQRINYQAHDELGQLAAVLDASFDELEQAIERQRQFAADASHELRTPLAAIRANVELLHSWAALDPVAKDTVLASLDQASRRASHLVADLLELAKLDRTPVRTLTPVRLDEVVVQAIREATPLRPEVPIRVTALGEAVIEGDPIGLQQVLLNLLDNALAFSPAGSQVRVALHQEDHRATVTISDSGPGIPASEMTRIFDRFYSRRLGGMQGPGAGLGLAIARAIAVAHGGGLTAANRSGGGATFTLVLPLAHPPAMAGQPPVSAGSS